MAKKKYTERYWQILWRQAVLANYNNSCARCGLSDPSKLECHHIVYRRHAILRYSWRNGVTGCQECHRFYHTKDGELWLMKNIKDYEWLCSMEHVQLKQYLVDNGMTRDEFMAFRFNELKDKINEK